MAMISAIKLNNKMSEINGKHCSPIDVARVNDQVVRMSYVDGEFHWHKHTNQDELFYILKGKIIIQLKEQPDVTLSEGQMVIIPKGVEHCPKSIEPSFVILFEPFILQTRGD
ncbi:cupin domain-containing protein [Thermoplasmatales archaeon SCGC AB-539-C06]|nr:cupin domain-containing protein [Thermoplasmatales archaeon SCGC AB-539-C06]